MIGELSEPGVLAQEAMGKLEAAMAELQGILQKLVKKLFHKYGVISNAEH